jgi:hypothetical protein
MQLLFATPFANGKSLPKKRRIAGRAGYAVDDATLRGGQWSFMRFVAVVSGSGEVRGVP